MAFLVVQFAGRRCAVHPTVPVGDGIFNVTVYSFITSENRQNRQSEPRPCRVRIEGVRANERPSTNRRSERDEGVDETTRAVAIGIDGRQPEPIFDFLA